MSSQDESAQQSSAMNNTEVSPAERTVPIIQTPAQSSPQLPGDPMVVTSPAAPTMGPPPARTSPDRGANGTHEQTSAMGEQAQNGSVQSPGAGPGTGTGAAAAAQGSAPQPKVQQTAFIHKLYNMLEDPSISHLISWSNSDESFVMSPSNDFSKVLSQYFKHTNISSFVRQLNMYGFHKVSDVFHTGSPESPLWEFKHGNGNFKRGDLVGLREIKRRASRHALVHRDSYPSVKPPPYSHPGTPAEPIQPPMDSTESRFAQLESGMYDMHARLLRSEEGAQSLYAKNQVLVEALTRSLQVNHEISRIVQSTVPNDANAHRSIMDMQSEIQRQTDVLRSLEEPFEPPYSGSRQYFSNLSLDNAPISPRQLAQDDHRRQHPMPQPSRPGAFRPVPSHLSIAPRKFGSIGAGTTASSPSSLRYQVAPPPPPAPHPLIAVSTPPTDLPRRHTSADIRVHTWPNQPPYNGEQSAPHWPSSPKRPLGDPSEDQRIRESFSSYSIQGATQNHTNASRPSTPPFGNSGGAPESLGAWSWGASRGDKFGGPGFASSGSGPPTRRGSMAHILNPAETAERAEEHDEELREEEDRKRKRLQ
ncbi:hypothetical protein V492_03976 [Pseudogymnoascus sp. VKM F-4246]|nr:hypothetical protein V492_03976 [Pseudogymnoascus sp. VKM F-4246]